MATINKATNEGPIVIGQPLAKINPDEIAAVYQQLAAQVDEEAELVPLLSARQQLLA